MKFNNKLMLIRLAPLGQLRDASAAASTSQGLKCSPTR